MVNTDTHDTENKPDGYYSLGRENMFRFVPQEVKRVLEIGCGEGRFGALLKERYGAEVWGVELSLTAAAMASDRLDRVVRGDIEDESLGLPDGYFDCIVCNDVLEHLVDPWRVLRRLKEKLTEDGCIVTSIPNVRYFRNVKRLLLYRDWKYTDEGILDRTHLRFFTKKSIVRLFDECGFDLQQIEGIGKKFRFHRWLLNTLCLNFLNDMHYIQFACVARKRAK